MRLPGTNLPRPDNAAPGRSSTRYRIFTALSLASVLVCWLVFSKHRKPELAGKLPTQAEIRGEPIRQNRPEQNEHSKGESKLGTGTNGAPATARKRPKPASFQRRAIESQVAAAKEGATNEVTMEPLAPPRLRNREALPRPAVEPSSSELAGFLPVGFDKLAGFHFDLDAKWMDGSAHPEEASAKALSLIPPEIRALHGKRVAVRGFLIPLRMDEGLAVEFLLVRDQNLCCYGVLPKINAWINVTMTGQGVKPVMDQPITVCGELLVGDWRENGYLVSLYKIRAERTFGP